MARFAVVFAGIMGITVLLILGLIGIAISGADTATAKDAAKACSEGYKAGLAALAGMAGGKLS
jgi:hypothetical protein